jgi:hypothetical protein
MLTQNSTLGAQLLFCDVRAGHRIHTNNNGIPAMLMRGPNTVSRPRSTGPVPDVYVQELLRLGVVKVQNSVLVLS